jgi:hypothetical protein
VPFELVRTGLSTSPILPGQRHFLIELIKPGTLSGESPRLDRAPTGTVPPGLPEHVEGWETNVRRTLASRLDLCARFDRAPFVTTQDIPGTLSNRLRERLGMLEAIERELIDGQHQD